MFLSLKLPFDVYAIRLICAPIEFTYLLTTYLRTRLWTQTLRPVELAVIRLSVTSIVVQPIRRRLHVNSSLNEHELLSRNNPVGAAKTCVFQEW